MIFGRFFNLLPLLIIALARADDNVCEVSETGAESTACLLQHNLGKEAPYVGLGSKRVSRKVSLFEMTTDKEAFGKEASRTEMVSAMLQQAQDRCQSYQAHSYFLRRSTHDLAQSLGALALAFGTPTQLASTKLMAAETAPITAAAATATAGVGPRGGVAMDAESASVFQTQVVSSYPAETSGVLAPQVPSEANEATVQEHAPTNSTKDTAPKEESSLKTVSKDEVAKTATDEKTAISEAVDADGDAENNEDADANDENAENDEDAETATALSQKKEDQEPEEKDDEESKVKTTQHDKLDEVVSKFIEGQSGSEDACHSKLLEARHQLNQLHDILTYLMTKVNTTETALILYDKDLQDKLKQLVKIEKWKDEELEKCRIKKEEDTKMFLKLSEELMEMHQIAMPSVSMNMTGGAVSIGKTVKYGNRVVEETKLSLVQAALQAVPQSQPGSSSRSSLIQDLTRVPELVDATHQAASHFQVCMHELQGSSLIQESDESQEDSEEDSEEDSASEQEFDDVIEYESDQEEDGKPKKGKGKKKKANLARNKRKDMKKDETYTTSQGEAASDKKCQEEKEKLEDTYVKAYVELSRLKAEYEALSKSTACFDAVNEEYIDRAPPLQEQAEKLAALSKEAAEELKALRPRLESAIEADKKLRKQVADLEAECKDLPETVSDLDKVRDAIRALSLCPGLYRADFKMPKFTGKFITFPQDATKQTDTEQDKAMQWACSQAFKGSRAAEFSEIEQRTVLGVPVKNDSPNALLGSCPRCAGVDDSDYKSGHARMCWAPDAPLNGDGVNSKCGKGTKSILCVVDQTSMRKIPGEGA